MEQKREKVKYNYLVHMEQNEETDFYLASIKQNMEKTANMEQNGKADFYFANMEQNFEKPGEIYLHEKEKKTDKSGTVFALLSCFVLVSFCWLILVPYLQQDPNELGGSITIYTEEIKSSQAGDIFIQDYTLKTQDNTVVFEQLIQFREVGRKKFSEFFERQNHDKKAHQFHKDSKPQEPASSNSAYMEYSEYGLKPELEKGLKLGKINWQQVPCDICKVTVDLIQVLFSQKKSTNEIKKAVNTLCVKLNLYDERVCGGVVNLFSAEVLTVVARVALSSREICGIIFGDECSDVYNPFYMWNVSLPNTPKPPVTPLKPPKPGSPKLRILQLSDIHLDFDYKVGSNADCGEPLCCRKDDGPSNGTGAGKWGDYRSCDTPTWTLEHLFQHLAQNETFDMIYWTGDLPGHNIWNQSRSDQLRALDYVYGLFEKYLPNKPMYPSLGNHESSPVNSFPPPYIQGSNSIEWLYEELLDKWSAWLPQDTHPTILKGAYYSVLLKPGYRLISLNMNYCNNENWWMLINITDPAGELAWLISELQHAEDNHEKVHILGHIPPGEDSCLQAWSWNYYRVINRYEGVIAGQFFGHDHKDLHSVFYDPETNFTRPVSVAYIGPSVTTYSDLNPGYKILEVDGFYDNTTWHVLDTETYIMNLTEANLLDQPKWTKEYSAKEAYGMDTLFPADWDKVLQRMETDDSLMHKYYMYYYKSHPPSPVCDSECKYSLLCEMRSGRSHDPELCQDIPHGYEALRSRRHRENHC